MKLDNSALFIETLSLTNFRNYDSVSIDTGGNSVILTGANGAGKTNILEAVSLLTPGTGIRRGSVNDFIKIDSNKIWGVSAGANSMMGNATIGTGYNEKNINRRAVKINSDLASQSDLGNYLSCIWLTPQMDRIWIESPAHRRKFIDRMIMGYDPAHSGRITAYEKAIRGRSVALKDGINDDVWLSAMEKDIASRGVAIASSRLNIIERLNNVISEPLEYFSPAILKCDGVIENWLNENPASDVEDKFINALKSSRPNDTINGGAEIGVHKTDIICTHLNKNMPANLCSTGEQKSLLIRIILGHLKMQKLDTGHLPILLLDEISAHLDGDKFGGLLEHLETIKPQIWHTATEVKKFADFSKNYTHFSIENSVLKKIV